MIKELTLLHHEALALAQKCQTFFLPCEPLLVAQTGNPACSWPPLDTPPSLSGADVHHHAASGRDEGGCAHRPAAKSRCKLLAFCTVTDLTTQNCAETCTVWSSNASRSLEHHDMKDYSLLQAFARTQGAHIVHSFLEA